MNANGLKPRKVLFVEFNEITWRIIDPLCSQGRLPTFADFQRRGTRGTPIAVEEPPNLDPWISWMTVYTGRPQEEHGVKFLEQPPETVSGPRVADLAADAGKSLGIYGSIMHWPPRRDIRGFWVPSTFSPDTQTFPDTLRPIQELNLSQTRAHTPLADQARPQGLVSRALGLMKLGLKPTTIASTASSLLRWKLQPHRKWEKVSLQPLINLDFFERAYRQERPDFATFHSNHVAHYMHRYWRSYDPAPFLSPPPAEEVRKYGPAIPFGYQVADRVLRRLTALADDDTVVVVTSALGQQPYVVEDFPEGRQVMRIRDIHKLMDLCGVTGACEPISMMAPQWNVKVPDAAKRAQAERILRGAWAGSPGTRLYAFETVGDTICLNIFQKNFKTIDMATTCGFPEADDARFRLGDLCAVQDATPKEGYHDRSSVALLRGPGIRKGGQLDACTNLDLAPTLLALMGLPIPAHMKGRVLEEAFESSPRVAVPAATTA